MINGDNIGVISLKIKTYSVKHISQIPRFLLLGHKCVTLE